MKSISHWLLDFSINQINFKSNYFGPVINFMHWLENEQYQVGEKTSVYVFTEEPNRKEFRANLYYNNIGILKLIINIDTEEYKKSDITIQKVKKAEADCIKIQTVSKQLEEEWTRIFSKRKYNIESDLRSLKDKILSITKNITVYPKEPKISDFALFLENLIKVKDAEQNAFTSRDNKLDSEKVYNIIPFMQKKSVLKLESNKWYLTLNGDYYNGNAPRQYEYGNIYNDDSRTEFIFKEQDVYINPFYISSLTYNPSKLDIASFANSTDFRLIYVEVLNSSLQGIQFDFGANKEVQPEEPFISVLIGPNGTGKSRALSIIESIYQDLYSLKTEKMKLNKVEYCIKYKMSSLFHEITVKENRAIYKINGNEVSVKEILLPQKLITCSYNVDDKFTYKSYNELNDNTDDFYDYLGIKSASNAVHVGATSKKLTLNIIKSKDNEFFWEKLNCILNFLGLSPTMKLRFKINDKLRNSNGIKFDEINDIINEKNINIEEVNKAIHEEDKNVYFDYLKSKEKNKNDFDINYEIDTAQTINNELKEELEIVSVLTKLKVLLSQGIEFKKKDFFKVEMASSGENHILFEMINILSYIKESSLILIDEPEISLHPNWQYKYVELLNTIFNNSTCHFIIATHSHFMISDLKPDSSSIISLDNDLEGGKIIAELLDEKTYGWSTEDVLYNVFSMKTIRNHFIEADLRKVLGMISMDLKDIEDIKEITRILNKLERLTLKPEDPMNFIIEQIRGYIKND